MSFKLLYPEKYYSMSLHEPVLAANSLSLFLDREQFETKPEYKDEDSPPIYKTLVISILATPEPLLKNKKPMLVAGQTVYVTFDQYKEIDEGSVGNHDVNFIIKNGLMQPNNGHWVKTKEVLTNIVGDNHGL